MYPESSGTTFDATNLHKTGFQEVTFLEVLKNFTTSYRIATIRGVIQKMGWTQFEPTSKCIMVAVENSSIGYDLTIGNLVKRGLYDCY